MMGNAEVTNLAPVREDERKELNLSRCLNYRQYCRHVEGRPDESSLKELPWRIRDSLCLYERMNASFNKITELPPELSLRMPHLCHLDLSHNQLRTLPDSIGLLFHLETILLNFNKIVHLPDEFFYLIKLKKLDLSHNCLRTVPNKFTHLESLEKLDISHNKMKSLPTSHGGLKTLKVLLAGNNRLGEHEESLCKCGSEDVLLYLRKNYNLSGQYSEQTSVNQGAFPRVRGNHLQTSVPNPHSAQVQYIQSQTHTANTSSRIKTPLLPPPGGSDLEAFTLRDKIVGLIYGAAIGDAVGVATCCMSSDECRFHYNTEMIDYADIVRDECRVRWKQGDWTSNFDTMALLLDSILGWAGVLDELEYAHRLYTWCNHGFPELGDKAGIVLSETVKQVIEKSEFLRNPHVTALDVLNQSPIHVYAVQHSPARTGNHVTDHRTDVGEGTDSSDDSDDDEDDTHALLFPSSHPTVPSLRFGTDNGAVVAITLLGVPFFHDSHEVELNTVRICKTTHAHPLCVASCVLITNLVSQMLQGRNDLSCSKTVEEMISLAVTMATKHITDGDQLEEFNRYVSCNSLTSVQLGEEYNMSYTLKAASAGLLALRSQQPFKSFMMNLFMEGGDSNSSGCVAGAVLGCQLGYSKLPPEWIQGLRKKQMTWLNAKINHLLDMIGLP